MQPTAALTACRNGKTKIRAAAQPQTACTDGEAQQRALTISTGWLMVMFQT